MWWPKMGADIKNYVISRAVCVHWRSLPIEPMIPLQLPELPWQKVAMNLFELDGKHYIVEIDYFMGYFELVELRSETADSIINVLKVIFACHSIPAVCFSDNCPCFSADSFSQFAKSFDLRQDNSRSSFPQSNGEAECTVEMTKNLLRKSSDPYLGLLAYRTMPTHIGNSLAQLQMGRKLCSTLLITTSALKFETPNMMLVDTKDQVANQRQVSNYNKCHLT